jgi:hypothetical protein
MDLLEEPVEEPVPALGAILALEIEVWEMGNQDFCHQK